MPDQGRIAGFEPLGELGRGAMGVVHRIRIDGIDYALKVHHDADPAALQAFRREAALLAGVDHPAVPQIHDTGETDGRPYLVMDLVDGLELADSIAGGPLPAALVVRLLLDLVGPLAALHRRGLVHRDVKSSNILLLPGGTARLIDFGMAARHATLAGTEAVGTLAYASPEQASTLKRAVDARSDLYSLGVVAFECLTGQLPFVTSDVGELLRMHAITPPPSLAELVPGIPPALTRIVSRLLAKDPDDRYQDAGELACDLEQLAPSLGIDADSRSSVIGLDARLAQPPMVGRDRQLSRLLTRWRDASAGHGGMAVVHGPGAIGKTRLLNEFAAAVELGGGLVLRGRAAEDRPMPMAPLRAAVDGLLAGLEGLPEQERAVAHERIQQAAGNGRDLLGPFSARLAEILGASSVDAETTGQARFSGAVAGLLAGLARCWPGLLLCLDDAPWLDQATLDVLARLCSGQSGLASLPVMVILSTRDDQSSRTVIEGLRALAGDTLDTELSLEPVAAEAIVDLVRWHLPGIELAERLGLLLAERSGGSPVLAQDYLRSIVDAGLLHPRRGRWQFDEQGLHGLALPEDAVGIVLARMQGLGKDALAALTTAAAIGMSFPAAIVAAACPNLPMTGAVLVDAAQRRLLLPLPGDTYEFVHRRVRAELLEPLDAELLADLHQSLALAMVGPSGDEEQTLAAARQFLAGRPETTPAVALPVLRAAGELSLARYAPADAVGFFEAASRLRGQLPDPADGELQLQLGIALQRAGRYAEAADALEQALPMHHARLDRGRILGLLAEVHRAGWEIDAARGALLRGLAELGTPLSPYPLAGFLRSLGAAVIGVLVLCTGLGRGTAREEAGERLKLIITLHFLGGYIGQLALRPMDSLIHVLHSIGSAARVGRGFEYVRAMCGCGVLFATMGLGRTARRFLALGAREAQRLGDPRSSALSAWLNGCAHYMAGWDEGELWIRALDDHDAYLDSGQASDAVASVLWDRANEGRTRELRALHGRSQEIVSALNGEITSMLTSDAIGLAAQGRTFEAVRSFNGILDLLASRKSTGFELNLLQGEMFLLQEQGDAGDRFTDQVKRFEALGLRPRLLIRAHRNVYQLQAFAALERCRLVTGDDRSTRLAHIRRAIRQLRSVARSRRYQDAVTVVTAGLRQLEGQPDRALQLLASLTGSPSYVPLLAFEAARIRARALLDLGCAEEASQQAQAALLLAHDYGWPHRARWIRAEFSSTPSSSDFGRLPGPIGQSSSTLEPDRHRERLRALEQVSRAASTVFDPDELARVALDETVRILAADRAFLFLTGAGQSGDADGEPHQNWQPLVPRIGRDAQGRDLAELTGYSASLVEKVRETREPLVVTGTDEGAALGAASVVLHDLRSIMIAPLELDGRLLGVVYLDSQVAKGIFTPDDVGILTALTNHVATALETARAAQLHLSVQAARRERDLAEQLRAAVDDMSRAPDPGDVLARMLAQAGILLRAHRCCLLRPAADGRITVVTTGGQTAELSVADDARLRALADVRKPSPQTGDLPVALRRAIGAAPGTGWLAVPVPSRGQFLGVLVAMGEHAYSDTDVEVAATLAAQAGTAFENAALLAQLRSRAVTDELTGIANRRSFFEQAADNLGGDPRLREFAVLMVDIDHFKLVNDTHGHATGDDVIREVAARLRSAIRDGDLLARYGGEEFALLLESPGGALPEPSGLGPAAERLRWAVARDPVQTRSGPVPVTISVGATLLTQHERDLTEALSRADGALYGAKQAGRNRVELVCLPGH